MYLNEYQKEALTTAEYPGRHELGGLVYTALGLAGEAGELANKVKKVLRGDYGPPTQESAGLDFITSEPYAYELGDILWYIAVLADELGYSLEDIARRNLVKLEGRKLRGTIKGTGDNR